MSYGKPAGASFPQTKLMPSRKTSPMCKDLTDDSCKEMLESIPEFNTLFERKSPEDVQQMLDEYLAGDNAEEHSAETTRYGGNTTATITNNSGSTVDDAFKELLGS